jgi:hypothetical protein
MGKVEEYRRALRELDDWDTFLLQESGLPGPRGNIELARAVAEEGDADLFQRYLALDADSAPTNSPQEFLAFCGVLGLGRLVAEGKTEWLGTLRERASDPRWRTREAVAMALQRLGDVDMDLLLREMEGWSRGNLLERRAVAAGLCEPRLLKEPAHVMKVLEFLDAITASIGDVEDRRGDEFLTLRKGLGYCWSVAVVALPEEGKRIMERWFSSDDKDVLWIMRENLKKKRLERMDAQWVEKWRGQLQSR